MGRSVWISVIAILLGGCLRNADVEPLVVTWSFDGGDALGCEAGREDVPLMRVRTHVSVSSAPDDEYIDWLPCATEDPVLGLEQRAGAITPLELGTYDVDVQMWTADRFWLLAHGTSTAILTSTTDTATVDVMMEPETGGYDATEAAGAL